MHKLIPLFYLVGVISYGQSVGVEHRFNTKIADNFTFLRVGSPSVNGFKFEGRYKFATRNEVRLTPSKTFKLGKGVKFKLPLHFNIHKAEFTLEPRLVLPVPVKRDDVKTLTIAVQKEFNHRRQKNAAIFTDYAPQGTRWKFRFGWDSGDYLRSVITYKF